jgi:ATP-dependent RNA helicase RhlE
LAQEGQWRQVLIFTRTKHGANRLTQQLCGAGIDAAAIHGNKSQAARVKALDMFKRGQVRALVATEVAARGLDIKELPQVVNYELPNVPEDYVHRIGRTGRAGAAGEAISLVSSDENGLLRDIERLLRREIPVLPTPQFKIVESAHQPSSPHDRPAGQHPGNRGSGNRPGNRAQGNNRPSGNRAEGGGHQGGQRDHARHGGGQRRFAQPQRGSGR